MNRKVIHIKEREVDIPVNVNQVYWYQYKKLISKEIELARPLKPLELVICFLGESEDYWRGLTDVEEYINVSGLLYRVYSAMKDRSRRTELQNILISSYLPPEKKKPFWKRIKLRSDGASKTEIRVDDKEYHAPIDLRWDSTGQYMDSLDVTSVIHSESDMSTTIEAWERLFKIYFYPIITGEEYKVEKAYEMNIDLVRFSDVVDFGGFFLIKLNRYPTGIKKRLPKLSLPSTKSKQGLTK